MSNFLKRPVLYFEINSVYYWKFHFRFQELQYAIYGIAAFMLLLSLLLFIDGTLATRTVKRDFDDGCKSTSCGICVGVFVSNQLFFIISFVFSIYSV